MPTSPLQLYVHIPYCVHKCPYCDFNSHVRNSIPWEDYGNAVIHEMSHWAVRPPFRGRKLSSLFIGGGTPSLAPPALIEAIITNAARHFTLTPGIEITLEANPGTVDAGHFAAYRAAGVNRLSIGVQSFNAGELGWLERIHDGAGAVRAFEIAQQAGFTNINLDLIYGLPGQELSAWMDSLEQAIVLGPEHMSCYQLTVEPHTLLATRHAKNPYPLPDDELALQFMWRTRERLAEAGFEAYEISNFARPGYRSRHNDGYWLYRDYVGVGAGASGKWDTDSGGACRYTNSRSPETYIRQAIKNGIAVGADEVLERRGAAAEAVWLGLRRRDGVSRSWFAERFGEDVLAMFGPELEKWTQSEAIEVDGAWLRLSKNGLIHADSIAADLF